MTNKPTNQPTNQPTNPTYTGIKNRKINKNAQRAGIAFNYLIKCLRLRYHFRVQQMTSAYFYAFSCVMPNCVYL
jgi:hypothetical protein